MVEGEQGSAEASLSMSWMTMLVVMQVCPGKMVDLQGIGRLFLLVLSLVHWKIHCKEFERLHSCCRSSVPEMILSEGAGGGTQTDPLYHILAGY